MIRSFLKGGIFYKTPQLHEKASISKDSDIVNKWYVDTKVNNTQINTKQYVDSRVASIPIVDTSSLVNISGNQNINGTKYFNSSPTVPNPTSGTHAANKAYVDSRVSSIPVIGNATATSVGGIKARLSGTTLYITTDGSNP